MGGVFGKKGGKKKKKRSEKQGGISDQDRAVLDLKNARDRLKKFQAKLEAEAAQLTATASKLLKAGKRDRALLAIKTRRFRETKVDDIDGQLLKLEELVSTIEWESQQVDVVQALRAGTDALNALHADALRPDKVADLMDDTADALATEREISAMLAGAGLDGAEEAALLAELEGLSAASVDVALPDLPAAPTTAIKDDAEVADADAAGDVARAPRVAVPA
jgi:hypothetical protein